MLAAVFDRFRSTMENLKNPRVERSNYKANWSAEYSHKKIRRLSKKAAK